MSNPSTPIDDFRSARNRLNDAELFQTTLQNSPSRPLDHFEQS